MGSRRKRCIREQAGWIEKNCSSDHRKTIYAGRKLAKTVAAIARKETGEEIYEYRCPFHSHYHLGHDATRQDRDAYRAKKRQTAKVSRVSENPRPVHVLVTERQIRFSRLGDVLTILRPRITQGEGETT